MAAKKSKTGKKKTTTKRAESGAAVLERAIEALPPEYRDAPPTIPIAVMIQEAKDVERAARGALAKLGGLGLDTSLVTSLRSHADALDEAEATWRTERRRAFGKAGASLQTEAIGLRSEIVAAGRFFLRADAKAQGVLDAIMEGTGVDDLIDDLGACARFVADHAEALEGADIEGGIEAAAQRASAIADELSGALSEQRVDTRAGEARARRDAIAAVVEHALDEIRATARYLYRKQPEKLVGFRSAYKQRAARGRGKKKRPAKDTPAQT